MIKFYRSRPRQRDEKADFLVFDVVVKSMIQDVEVGMLLIRCREHNETTPGYQSTSR